MSAARPRARADQGSVAVELTLLAPVIVAILLFVVALGRWQDGAEQVQGAARDAARAASLAADPQAALAAARAGAAADLASAGLSCAQLAVQVDLASLAASGLVAARVGCRVNLAGLVPGLPGARTVWARSVVPIERYRQVRS